MAKRAKAAPQEQAVVSLWVRRRVRKGYDYTRAGRRVHVKAKWAREWQTVLVPVEGLPVSRAAREDIAEAVAAPAPPTPPKPPKRRKPRPKPPERPAPRTSPVKPWEYDKKRPPSKRRRLPKPDAVERERRDLLDKLKKEGKTPPLVPDIEADWLPASDYQQEVEGACEEAGFPMTDIDDAVSHADPGSDWVHGHTLFTWHERKLPQDLAASHKAMGNRAFNVVRIFFLVAHLEKEVTLQWVWSAGTARHAPVDWYGAWDLAKQFYAEVEAQIGERWSYLQARGLVAWTAYQLDEKAPYTRGRVGGDEPPEGDE